MNEPDQSKIVRPGEGLGRRQFLRGIAATGALAGAGGLLSACGTSRSLAGEQHLTDAHHQLKHGGNLIAGFAGGSSTDTVDPHKSLTYVDTARLQALYQPLIQLNAAAEPEYVLAESITPRNGSASEWIIKLRPGITFHNGKDLSADDVLSSFRRVYTNGFSGKIGLGPIDLKASKALDKTTVLVKMTKPFASFAEQLAAFWYNLYIAPAGFDPATPVGTGAFVYQSFTPGERSVFVRNPNYWRSGLPYLGSLTIQDFGDANALQAAVTTGVIHAAAALNGQQIAGLSNVSGVKTVVSQSGAIVPFTMRVDQPPFNDVNVRQALRLLVNRSQMIDSALDGYGVVASDVFSPYDPDFDHSLARPAEGDIPQAKALLKKAGKEGLTVTLVTSDVSTGVVPLATVFKQQAQAAGVTINISNVPSGTFFGRDYLQWTFSQDFYNYFPYLSQVGQSMLKVSPYNETHFYGSDVYSRYLSLYNDANSQTDPGKRKEIEYEMQQIDFNYGGYIIPAFVNVLDAWSTKVGGYQKSKVGQPLSNFDWEHFGFLA
jgi:peptide/nickel transport system substrate-binding protein